jgi:hypothetical protein
VRGGEHLLDFIVLGRWDVLDLARLVDEHSTIEDALGHAHDVCEDRSPDGFVLQGVAGFEGPAGRRQSL